MKDVQLLWVYNSRLGPGTVVKNHTHNYYHLLSINQGSMRFFLDQSEHILQAGDMVLVNKGVGHSFLNDWEDTTYFTEIKFTVLSQALNTLLEQTEEQVLRDEFATRLVNFVAEECAQSRNLKDEAADAALKTLILHLTAQTRQTAGEDAGVIDTTGYNKLSKQVIDYLSGHYAENLSLDEVSRGVNISKNYLCNAFKLNTGITINECLNMIRVRRAAELIVYSDLPLNQVARMCGYVSASHFNRVFMRYVGIPPGQCRRAYSYDLVSQKQRTPGTFIYSVLAGKNITTEVINEYETRKKD